MDTENRRQMEIGEARFTAPPKPRKPKPIDEEDRRYLVDYTIEGLEELLHDDYDYPLNWTERETAEAILNILESAVEEVKDVLKDYREVLEGGEE